ncbi:erythrocyte membrane associated protein 2 [Diplonema papillatum]|nr:erythrocyte membrane associated protein 2 [Diplonema papillatum]
MHPDPSQHPRAFVSNSNVSMSGSILSPAADVVANPQGSSLDTHSSLSFGSPLPGQDSCPPPGVVQPSSGNPGSSPIMASPKAQPSQLGYPMQVGHAPVANRRNSEMMSYSSSQPTQPGYPVQVGQAALTNRGNSEMMPISSGQPLQPGYPVQVGQAALTNRGNSEMMPISSGQPLQPGYPVQVGQAALTNRGNSEMMPISSGQPLQPGYPVQVGQAALTNRGNSEMMPISSGQPLQPGYPVQVGQAALTNRGNSEMMPISSGQPLQPGYPVQVGHAPVTNRGYSEMMSYSSGQLSQPGYPMQAGHASMASRNSEMMAYDSSQPSQPGHPTGIPAGNPYNSPHGLPVQPGYPVSSAPPMPPGSPPRLFYNDTDQVNPSSGEQAPPMMPSSPGHNRQGRRRSTILPAKQFDPDWDAGVFGCFGDVGVCCDVICCYFCDQARLYSAHVDNRPDHCNGTVCFCLFAGTAISSAICFVPLAAIGYTCWLRESIRSFYGIDGNCCYDLLASLFCNPCATCQMHRELSRRGTSPGTTCCAPRINYEFARRITKVHVHPAT